MPEGNFAAFLPIVPHLPENSYRIGGDEFVIILPESGKAEFEEQMEQVQEDLKQAHISYSMGLEWKKEGMQKMSGAERMIGKSATKAGA